MDGQDPKTLRDTLDRVKNRLSQGVVVLATVRDEKVNLIAGVTDNLTDRVKAGDLIGFVAAQVGGRGDAGCVAWMFGADSTASRTRPLSASDLLNLLVLGVSNDAAL